MTENRMAFEVWWGANIPNDPMYSHQAWIAWKASRDKALEEAEKAIVAADGCGEPLVLALASVRALKEQA